MNLNPDKSWSRLENDMEIFRLISNVSNSRKFAFFCSFVIFKNVILDLLSLKPYLMTKFQIYNVCLSVLKPSRIEYKQQRYGYGYETF